MDKNTIVNIASQYKVLLLEIMNLDSVYLFGSYAKGTNRADSDIDIAVVIDEPIEDFFKVVPPLWKLRRQIDDRIEPILIDKNNDPAGFLDDIKSYGIKI